MFKTIISSLFLVSTLTYASSEPSIIFHNLNTAPISNNGSPVIKFEKVEAMPKVENIVVEKNAETTPGVTVVTAKKNHYKNYSNKPKVSPKNIVEKPVEELTSVPRKDWALINGQKKPIDVSQPLMVADKNLEKKMNTPKVSPQSALIEDKVNLVTEVEKESKLMTWFKNIPWITVSMIFGGLVILAGLFIGVYMFFARERDDELSF